MDPDGFETCSYRRVIDIGYNVYSKLFGFQFPIVLVMLYLNAGVYYAFRGAKTQRSVTVFRTVFYYAFRGAKTQRSVIVFRTVFYYAFCRAKTQRTVTVFRTVLYYAKEIKEAIGNGNCTTAIGLWEKNSRAAGEI